MTSSPRRSLAMNVTLSVLSIIVFFFLAEALATFMTRSWVKVPPGIQDAIVGFRLRPYHAYREVGGADVTTNSRGFREEEISPKPVPGGVRILAVGDSSTFGYGVTRDEAYVSRLEKSLSDSYPGRLIEIINAGTPGWTTAHGAAFLANEGLDWKPNVVLVNFGYNEQLGASSGAPHYDYDATLRRVRYHSLGESNSILFKDLPPEKPQQEERFLDRFEDFPARLKLTRLLRRSAHEVHHWILRLAGGFKSSDLASWLIRQVYTRDPSRIHASLNVEIDGNHVVRSFASRLEQIFALCRKIGASPVVVLQPRRAYREFLSFLPKGSREANLKGVALLEEGNPSEAIVVLEAAHRKRPQDAITIFNLAVAYRLAGDNVEADRLLEKIMNIRSFTMNAAADITASRFEVPVVYTPLPFEVSDRKDLFFPDRYHTRSAGFALVAREIEEVLIAKRLIDPWGGQGNQHR